MQLPLIKNLRGLKLLILVLVLSLMSGCVKDYPYSRTATEESANVLYDWYNLIARIQLQTSPSPAVIQNNRDFGYIGVGVYESVRPGIKGGVSLSSKLYQMPTIPDPDGHKDYLWSASANAALASMFRQFFPNLSAAHKLTLDSLENAYNNRFKLSTSDAVISRSQGYGRSVASIIYNWSTTEKFTLSSVGWVLPVFPGSYVLTPPAFPQPVGAFLTDSRPFLKSSLTVAIPPPPYEYSEHQSSAFYKAAKEVYNVGKALTPAQKAIANFWADVGGVNVGIPGPGHIISIITGVLQKKEAKLGGAAELYAKTGIAFKDAFYRIWKGKYQYNLLRPITYINKLIDPVWTSYLPNPPYPDHPSGLVGVYSGSLYVLVKEYGDIPVTDNAYVWNGSAPKQFNSITALVDEAAFSRLYGGIHYMFAMEGAKAVGWQLANEIHNLNPVKSGHHSGY